VSPLELILSTVSVILFISCVGLAVLYRHCSEDSVRLLWFIEKEARMFKSSGFIRWSTPQGFQYVDIDGMGYRANIDTARDMSP